MDVNTELPQGDRSDAEVTAGCGARPDRDSAVCGSVEELSGECCSCLLEGPAYLRLPQLPGKRSGFLGPAILPLDGGLSSWCPPACGPP